MVGHARGERTLTTLSAMRGASSLLLVLATALLRTHSTHARKSPATASVLSLSPFVLSTEPFISLTFTSVGYNPTSTPSNWVSSTFNDSLARTHYKSLPVTSACSIEMLGIMWSWGTGGFYGGDCRLTLEHWDIKMSAQCFYRGMFEEWRAAKHYSLVFFCPVTDPQDCAVLDFMSDHSLDPVVTIAKVEGEFRIPLTKHKQRPVVYFRTQIPRISLVGEQAKRSRKRSMFDYPNEKPNYEVSETTRIRAAVCTVLPYVANRRSSRKIHHRMLLDWIAYYSALDFDIFIYDKHENHEDEDFAKHERVRYFGYTVGEHVVPTRNIMEAGRGGLESSASVGSALVLSDEDKVMTLNHCRFEARAMHGIDVIIVADVDEFLYCKNDDRIPQRRVVQNMLQYFDSSPLNEVGFGTLYPSCFATNYTEFRNCQLHHAILNQTVFPCYASIDYTVYNFIEKTIYLGMNCPITGYHRGCPSHESFPGLCDSCVSQEHGKCRFVHLSNRADVYNPEQLTKYRVPRVSVAEEAKFLSSKLELANVI